LKSLPKTFHSTFTAQISPRPDQIWKHRQVGNENSWVGFPQAKCR